MTMAMIAALLFAAAPAGPAAQAPAGLTVNRSLSDSDRLRELEIAVRDARARGEISPATAVELHLGVARARRQMTRMGIQVGYRQKVRLRARIDALHARLAQRQSFAGR